MKRVRFLVLMLGLMVAPALAAAQQTTVILVRHAERVAGPGDVALTDAGKARAARLADLLRDSGINAIFSTPYNRTKDTAQPTSQLLGIPVLNTNAPGAAFAPELARKILSDHKGQTVLVVGHSNTTPDVIKALGAAPVPAIPDPEYDNLFVVRVDAGGNATVIRAKY